MTMHTPAADQLAAKIKAALSIGKWGIEMTTQEADTLLAETRRLAAANPLDGMTPQDCALGAHPAWAIEGEKSLPCPWCALEQARAELEQLGKHLVGEPCGNALVDDDRFGPCVRTDGHEWHRDATGASWIESAADMQRRIRA